MIDVIPQLDETDFAISETPKILGEQWNSDPWSPQQEQPEPVRAHGTSRTAVVRHETWPRQRERKGVGMLDDVGCI